jgi:hypothetical protein
MRTLRWSKSNVNRLKRFVAYRLNVPNVLYTMGILRERVNPLFEDIVAQRFNVPSVPGTMSSTLYPVKKGGESKGYILLKGSDSG